MKYVKLVEGKIEYPPKNKDNILNYDLNIELLIADGYKEFIEVERPTTNRFYHIEYQENETNITEVIVYDETQEEANLRILIQAKQDKNNENDEKAEFARENQQFTLKIQNKDCVFQTTRKTQQDLSTAKDFIQMTGQPYQWFSDNNEEIYLTLEDVLTISTEFMQKANVYPIWSNYKSQIDNATTVEAVEAIEIDYGIEEE